MRGTKGAGVAGVLFFAWGPGGAYARGGTWRACGKGWVESTGGPACEGQGTNPTEGGKEEYPVSEVRFARSLLECRRERPCNPPRRNGRFCRDQVQKGDRAQTNKSVSMLASVTVHAGKARRSEREEKLGPKLHGHVYSLSTSLKRDTGGQLRTGQH